MLSSRRGILIVPCKENEYLSPAYPSLPRTSRLCTVNKKPACRFQDPCILHLASLKSSFVLPRDNLLYNLFLSVANVFSFIQSLSGNY